MSETPPVELLLTRLAELEARVERLEAENAELRRRLGQDSHNSSKPPSSDSPFGPKPKSLRKKSGRAPGGQPGREGRTLEQVSDPDRVIEHEPVCCRGCGAGLAGCPETARTRRQCFDLPPVRVEVTEHQLIERECPCGTRTSADAPAGVGAPVQYGPRILAVIVYLYIGQFLSKKRTAQALNELFAVPVSEGTVAAAVTRAAGGLGAFLGLMRERISAAGVVNFDETGLRVDSKLRWVHSASTGQYSLIVVHEHRGTKGMAALGVLPGFTGIAVHDAWAPYDTYTAATHALCNAHVLRELQAVIDHGVEVDPDAWSWAGQSADALRDLKHHADAAAEAGAGLDAAAIADALRRYRSGVRVGANATAARTDKVQSKHHALARRLMEREADYLRFLHDPAVPFDNNAAEREIRMVKLRQKVSGCLRTLSGAEQFAAIRSYLATATKHRIGHLQALSELAEGHAWMPA